MEWSNLDSVFVNDLQLIRDNSYSDAYFNKTINQNLYKVFGDLYYGINGKKVTWDDDDIEHHYLDAVEYYLEGKCSREDFISEFIYIIQHNT